MVVTVTGTSQADTTKSATATVYLLPPCVSNGYSYVHSIVIDHSKVPNTNQVNFPFLFSSTDPSLKSTANGGHVTSSQGYDIIFSTDPAGQSKLDFEIEEYDPVHGQLIAWIRIPTLLHAEDTPLYLFYGNSSITTSQQNPTGVWDSNTMGVWHLPNGTTLSANDSTANGFNGANSGATATTGMIDGGASFDGTSYIDVGNLGNFPTQGSIDFWMKTSSLANYPNTPNAFTTNYNGGNNAIRFEEDYSGDFSVYIGGGTDIDGHGFMTQSMKANTWYHIALTWDVATSTAIGYVNGTQAFDSTSNILWPTAIPNLAIASGYDTCYCRKWNGIIDEARIANTVRSADWIATEYNNESSPSTFYLLNAESNVTVSPSVANLHASQSEPFSAAVLAAGTCSSDVNWSLQPGAPGTLSGGGVYTAPQSITAPASVIITATSQSDSTKTGSAIVNLLPSADNPTVKLAALSQSPYFVGNSEQFAATLAYQDGTPVTGATVSFTVSGSNSATGSATTNSQGIATYSYSGIHSGSDTIQASTTVIPPTRNDCTLL